MSDLNAVALNAIADAEQALSVSELHGAVVGIAVCDALSFSLQALVNLIGVDALSDEVSVEEFVRQTLDELMSEDMSFSLLLPGDEENLLARLEALAEWSSSFLAGLAAGLNATGVASLDELPPDAQEIVADLVAIAEIETESEAEDAESDLFHLEEFVKVGVLLLSALLTEDTDEEHDADDSGQ